ncbi:MAG: response regulator [Planctomycetota bacterium]|nr:MAG: response regulator [Planctomycetota bacterium]
MAERDHQAGEFGEMNPSKTVTVVHPASRVRIALRGTLEHHGWAVATDHSCADLLMGDSGVRPDLILLDRSLLADDGSDMLSLLRQKWEDTEIVFLPAAITNDDQIPGYLPQLLGIVDRLLKMRTTREILAI